MTCFQHRRVKDAEYRVRKMRNRDQYSVTEYYKGDRVQLCDNFLTFDNAVEFAKLLAYRKEF